MYTVQAAVRAAYAILNIGGTALEAVVAAVKVLEDDKWGNAGKGSVLNADGRVEMDASVMDGRTMDAGAVGAIKRVRNPVEAAKAVMENTRHVFLAGQEATDWAVEHGLNTEDEVVFIIALYSLNIIMKPISFHSELLCHIRKVSAVAGMA